MTVQSSQINSISPPVMQDSKLSLSHYLTYSIPFLTMAWLSAPIHVLQGVYAKYYGFPLTTLASIILLARLFDAVTDPLIGYYADRYHRRTGTRKPFVVVGGFFLILSGYFLYVPVGGNLDGANVNVSVAYFAIWFMALYLAMTLFEIPHAAWGSELAHTSEEKSKIFSYRMVAGSLGMVCFYSIPLLPMFETQDITPATLKVSVIIAGVLMLPLLYLCIKKTPSAPPTISSVQMSLASNRKALFQAIIGNKPLLIFFGAFLAYGFGVGMWYSLIFFYVDSYLGLGEEFAKMFILSFIVGIIATPIWCKLSLLLGKKTILVVAMLLLIASSVYARLLVPGVAGFRELLILQTTQVLGGTCMLAFAPAMLSEVIDFSTFKYRIESTATYYAIYMFLAKINIAIGGAIGLAIAGWYGFDATTTDQSSEGIFGLMVGITWLPIVFIFIALILIVLSPINTRRHGIIRRRLDTQIATSSPLRSSNA